MSIVLSALYRVSAALRVAGIRLPLAILFPVLSGPVWVRAQTVYTWNATGGGDWTLAANWTPARSTIAPGDILQFNDGGTYNVINVPTQPIRQLLVSGNTSVTLLPATTNTLSINGLGSTDNVSVAAGSTLTLGGSGALTLTIITTANQRGNIAGTLQLGTGSTFTTTAVGSTVVTVASGGTVNNINGTVTSSAATLSFAGGGTYIHARNGGAVPTATWNAASQCTITGITNTAPTAFTGTFGHVTWNCAGQTATPYGITNATTVAGNLNVTAGNFTTGTFAFTVTGTSAIASGATLTHGTAGLKTFTGDFTNNGTWTSGNGSTFSFGGNLTNNGTFTAGTGVHTFTGTAKNIDGSATSLAIPSVTVSGTYTGLVPAFGVSTALAGGGTLTLGSNTVLNIGGTAGITTLNCTANTPNEVQYTGTGAQTAKTTTYHHLTVNKPAGIVLSLNTGTTQVNGNVNVLSGILSDNANTLSVTAGSQLNIADGAIYRTTKTTAFFPTNLVMGNLNFNTTGGFDYASASGTTYALPAVPTTYGILYVSNGGVTAVRNLSADIQVYSLSVTTCALDENGFAIAGNPSGTLTISSNGDLRINHASQNFPSGFVTANVSLDPNSRVTYASAGTQTVSAVPSVYGHLYTLNGGTKNLTANTNLAGLLNVGAGTVLDLRGYTLSIAGSGVAVTLNGQLEGSAASSTLRFTGSALQQVSLPVARLNGGYLSNLVAANASALTQLSSPTQTVNTTVNAGATLNLNSNTLGVSGQFVNNGLIQGATATSILEMDGTSGLQNLALGTPTGTVAFRLKINNPSGVTLTAPALTGGLDLTAGLLNTDATNLLTVNTSASTGSVTGGSSASFVNGPMARQFSASFSTAGTYTFPVGKSDLKTFSLVNPTTTALTTVRAEVFDMASGGTGAPGLDNLQNRYWQASVTGGAFTGVGAVQLTENGLTATNAIGQSATQTGVYQLIGGTLGAGSITSENPPALSLNYFAIGDRVPLSGTVQVGPGSVDGYFSLTQNGGLFQAINTRGLSGNLTANIVGDITTEDGTHALNAWNEYGGSGYTLTVQTSGPARSISGTYNGTAVGNNGLFRINGADRATFTGGSGTDRLLTFRNTNTGAFAAVFNFLGDATDNRIDHCNLEGAPQSTTNAVLYFGTGVSTGNDNNVIDRCDIRDLGTATPNNAVFSLGSSAALANTNTLSDCNISNYFHVSQISCGVLLSTNNSSWTISGNRFFQTVTRTNATNDHFVIQVNDASSTGHSIVNNVIGYASAAETGSYTMTNTAGGANARFVGIYLSALSSANPVNTVSGNRVQNITFSSNSGGSPNFGVFSGIYLGSGKANINGNTIGSMTGTGSIATLSNTNGGTTYGIRVQTTSTSFTVNSNNIGGISISGGTASTNTGVLLHGISLSAGSATVDGNTVGSPAVPGSLQLVTSNATSNTVLIAGIVSTASASYSQTISNNTVANLSNPNTGTGAQAGGILTSSGGQYTLTGNTVRNLASASTSTGTGSSASVMGISMNTGNNTALSITGNTVYGLSNSAATANVVVTGIYFSGGTSTSNLVNRNLVHGLSLVSSGTTANIWGILLGGGYANAQNNMLRLGWDATGSPLTNAVNITGIAKDNTSTNLIYFNSVLIGGTGVGSAALNTYAFRRLQTGTDIVRNNIFANARSNAGAGGKHTAIAINVVTNLTCNHNVYHAGGTGAVLALIGATDQVNLQAFRGNFTGQNLNSGVATMAQINFVAPNAAVPDLHLNNANCASGAGLAVAGIGSDFDDVVTRASAPAIGAHESAAFQPLDAVYDIYTPMVSVAPVGNLSASCGSNQTVTITATVTDLGTGTATGSLAPTLWWRESTGTYAPLLPSSSSGSTYTYTLNLTGISAGKVYHYYVAAQDRANTPNVWYSHFAATNPVHTDVSAAPSPIIVAPGTFSAVSGTPLSGIVTVGTGGTYPTFNGAAGLFAAINTNGLGGNLTARVISDISETAFTPLTAIGLYCGGQWELRIEPVDATLRTVSGSTGQTMLAFNGASRVTVDGNYSGAGSYLTFRNTQAHPAFWLNGGANTITIKNCTIESSNVSSTAGAAVIVLGGPLATGSTGIRKVSIDNNTIRYRTTGAFGGYSKYMILSSNVSAVNDSLSITRNNISDWSIFSGGSGYSAAIAVQTNGGGNHTISDNSLFTTFIDGTGQQFGIDFRPGTASTGNRITGNYIGGSAPLCGGANAWRNNTATDVIPLFLSVGSDAAKPTVVSGNTIQRIDHQGGGTSGGGITAVQVDAGRVNLTDNVIGHPSLINSLVSSAGGMVNGNDGWVYGIYSVTADSLVMLRNIIGGIAATGAIQGYCTLIEHTGAGIVYMDNNVLGNSYNGGATNGANSIGLYINNAAQGHYISRLRVMDLGSSSSAPDGTEADGIILKGSCSGTLIRSQVSNLFHLNNGGWSAGIAIGSTGNWTVSNNTVNMQNRSGFLGATYTTRKDFYGIYEIAASGTHRYYNNTVLVQGSQTGTSSAVYPYGSAAFYKLASGSGSGSGANVILRNNVLLNNRTGNPNAVTRHYAIDNTSSSPSVNWDVNYNLLLSANTAWLGYWEGTGDRSFSQWKTSSGGDANSWNVVGTTGVSSESQLNPADLFTDVLTGDLTVKKSDQACWFLNGKGVAGAQNGSLANDFSGDVRETTYGLGIDLGADEFTPDPGVLPHALTAVPTPGGTNIFTFAGRTFGSLTWGSAGTLPTSVTARYYSGDAPGITPSPAFSGVTKADFMVEYVPTGGAGYTYNSLLYYDDAQLGDYVATESAMRMIKTQSTNWIDVTSSVDASANILSSTAGLTQFSFFSGGVPNTDPLPVKLTAFEGNCESGKARFTWMTASELNNERFVLQRSPDLQDWEDVKTLPGAGTSNQALLYHAVDERPLPGLSYYRLTQTDFDGVSETFAPVSLGCSGSTAEDELRVFPNPATDHFMVSVTTAADLPHAGIEILDMNGKTVWQKNMAGAAGTFTLSVDATGLGAGTYLVRLRADGIFLKPVKLILK